MTIAAVHRWGVFATAILWGVAVAAIVVDIAAGILLSVPVLVASLGVSNAVRVYLTRRWPRVEAIVWQVSAALDSATGNRRGSGYPQRLHYEFDGQPRETSLTWTTEPPKQVVLRVNPDNPAEVFCLEQVGEGWVSFLLVAVLLPPVVAVLVWFGAGRLPRFVAGLGLLAAIAIWGRRLLPADRPDSRGTPAPGARTIPGIGSTD